MTQKPTSNANPTPAAPASHRATSAGAKPPSAEPKPPSERRYAGMTADERRAERRRRLLDTALELFGTDGYAYTGIERLCSHAGVTARHFYEEFGSREGLLIALYDEIVRATLDAVAAAVAAAPQNDHLEMTRAGMLAFVHGMLDDPRRARVQCLEVVGVSQTLEHHRREVLHLYADLVSEQSRALGLGTAGASTERQRRAASIALVGGTNELLIEWLTDHGTYDASVDELIDDLVRIYVAVGRDDRA
jgi:AcrR family transcriptional regulator